MNCNFYFKMLITSVIIVFSISGLVGSHSNVRSVVFDNSVGFFGLDIEGPTGFSELRNTLEIMGFSVSDSLELKANYDEITSNLLRNQTGILVLINPIRPFSSNEREVIEKFIQGGGKLLLINDDPSTMKNANELAKDFGVRFLGQYIDSTELPVKGGSTHFFSTMPMKYEGGAEPETGFKIRSTSRTWESFWEIGAELPEDENYLFIGAGRGFGRAFFLSDKDFMLNQNFDENTSRIVESIFSWLESGKPVIFRKPEPSISPINISMLNYYGTTSYFRFIVSNPTDLIKTVSITLPATLEPAVDLDRDTFKIGPSSNESILATVNCPENVSHVYDFMNVTIISGKSAQEHLVPIEVSCVARE